MKKKPGIPHTLTKDGETYNFVAQGLTEGEAQEFLIALRRLELYRVCDVDTDLVETAMKTMASFQTRVPK